MKLNERQIATMKGMVKFGSLSADRLAGIMGYSPRVGGRLAVSSTLRRLQAEGLVGRSPPKDQWDCAKWFLTDAGRSLLNQEKEGQ